MFFGKKSCSVEFHALSNGENRNLVAFSVLEIFAFKDTQVSACEKVVYATFERLLRNTFPIFKTADKVENCIFNFKPTYRGK